MSGATSRRVTPPKPAARRVSFADRGQGFTRWDLDEDGVVIESWPEGVLWRGVRVLNHQGLRHGSELQLVLADGSSTVLQHRADMVARLPVPGRAPR